MELGIDKLRGLADSGYISGGEELRRKELIEQFFEYQSDLLDCNDDHYYYITHIFSTCWRNVFKLFAIGSLVSSFNDTEGSHCECNMNSLSYVGCRRDEDDFSSEEKPK